MRGKLIIISAPSGTGKSTIIGWLMKEHPELNLAFSISCTSRPPRGTEQNGVEYFFLTPEEFRQRIDNDEFLEYEEVYEGRFYGTLKAQVERQLEAGQNVVFDVDVKGGVNIKNYYGDEAMSVFIQPPSIAELRKRLEGRGTDAPEVIDQRIARAEFELTFADQFGTFVPPSKQEGQMLTIQEALYAEQTQFGETDYSALLAGLSRHVTRRSLLILYTSFTSMASMRRQLQYLRQLALRHRLLVVFFEDEELKDYITSGISGISSSTESVYQHVIAEKFVYEQRLIVQTLRQYGIQSLLTTPRNLSVDVINKYLEIKSKM
jgi:guanylate kinase